MSNAFFKLLGRIHLKRITRQEKAFGYKLSFPRIPEFWINGWAVLNLTKNWMRFDLMKQEFLEALKSIKIEQV